MKWLFVFIIILFPLHSTADSLAVHSGYTQANGWLRSNHLIPTVGKGSSDIVASYMQGHIIVAGEAGGNPNHKSKAQSRLGAERAAEIVARKNLLDYLSGYALAGNSSLRDAGAIHFEKDILRMIDVKVIEYSEETDSAIALLQIPMTGKDGLLPFLFEFVYSTPAVKKMVESSRNAYGAKQKLPDVHYDGLIIDTADLHIRPALFNRIFTTNNEILFSPLEVPYETLVSNGGIAFVNTVAKAKTALARRGVHNPLVVHAAGKINSGDIMVSENDALVIFAANSNSRFLEKASLALVIK